MAAIQFIIKDNSITTLKKQKQKATLASLTHLLKQPGLTIKRSNDNPPIVKSKTAKNNIIGDIKTFNTIARNTPKTRPTSPPIIDQKKTANSTDKLKTPNNIVQQKPNTTHKGNGTLKRRNKEQNRMKEDSMGDAEYYPEKIKRKLVPKKSFLKPKHEYHVIGTTNKRKRCTPIKDVRLAKNMKASVSSSPVSDSELMNEHLTDEDLMEILTCPSPVWWEDPPDGCFDEEPISTFCTPNPNLSLNQPPTQPPKTQLLTDNTNNQLKEKKRKLERLLNNLKEMKVKVKDNEVERTRKQSSESSDMSICDEELIKSLESIKIPIKTSNDTEKETQDLEKSTSVVKEDIKNDAKPKTLIDKQLTNECTDKFNNTDKMGENMTPINENKNTPTALYQSPSPRKKHKRSPKKTELTTYYNTTAKCPKILRKDRNNCIFVQKIDCPNSSSNENDKSVNTNVDNNKSCKLTKLREQYLEILSKRSMELNLVPKHNVDAKSIIKAININLNNNFTEHNNVIDKEVTTNTNIKYNDKNASINSTKPLNTSIISTNDDTNTNINKALSINCNNIKDKKSLKNQPSLDTASPISIKSINSDATDNSENYTISDSNVKYIDEYIDSGKTDELVTVYKILSKSEREDEKNSYMDVPGVNMKYCYNCSTIFDTDMCLYCVKKVGDVDAKSL